MESPKASIVAGLLKIAKGYRAQVKLNAFPSKSL